MESSAEPVRVHHTRKEEKVDPALPAPAPLPVASTSALPRPARTTAQVLADEVLAPDAAPDRKGAGRLLTDGLDPWSENAWDNVEWGAEQELMALDAVEKQKAMPVPHGLQLKFNGDPASYWDKFYLNMKGTHDPAVAASADSSDRFFNDRAWLRLEFNELAEAVKPDVRRRLVSLRH